MTEFHSLLNFTMFHYCCVTGQKRFDLDKCSLFLSDCFVYLLSGSVIQVLSLTGQNISEPLDVLILKTVCQQLCYTPKKNQTKRFRQNRHYSTVINTCITHVFWDQEAILFLFFTICFTASFCSCTLSAGSFLNRNMSPPNVAVQPVMICRTKIYCRCISL